MDAAIAQSGMASGAGVRGKGERVWRNMFPCNDFLMASFLLLWLQRLKWPDGSTSCVPSRPQEEGWARRSVGLDGHHTREVSRRCESKKSGGRTEDDGECHPYSAGECCSNVSQLEKGQMQQDWLVLGPLCGSPGKLSVRGPPAASIRWMEYLCYVFFVVAIGAMRLPPSLLMLSFPSCVALVRFACAPPPPSQSSSTASWCKCSVAGDRKMKNIREEKHKGGWARKQGSVVWEGGMSRRGEPEERSIEGGEGVVRRYRVPSSLPPPRHHSSPRSL